MNVIIKVIITISVFPLSLSIIHIDANGALKDQSGQSTINIDEIIYTIDSLGYFKYVENNDLNKIKHKYKEIWTNDEHWPWGGIWDDSLKIELQDYRSYGCHGEDVFEEDGITTMLNTMQPTFEKIGFELTIDDHFEEWDYENEWTNHRITLNGTEYILFKNFKRAGWDEAIQKLVAITNIELKKQNTEEKIYLVNDYGVDYLIFLDKNLYNFLRTLFANTKDKPLSLEEWSDLMHLPQFSIDRQ